MCLSTRDTRSDDKIRGCLRLQDGGRGDCAIQSPSSESELK